LRSHHSLPDQQWMHDITKFAKRVVAKKGDAEITTLYEKASG
jgi:hypothetical protein